MVKDLKTTLKDGEIFVLGIGDLLLDKPITMKQFQKLVRDIGQAVSGYFDQLLELNAKLKSGVEQNPNTLILARALESYLMEQYQKEKGVTIFAIRPIGDEQEVEPELEQLTAEPVSAKNTGSREHMAAQDWHIKYAGIEDVTSVEDIRRTQLVLLSEQYVYENTTASQRQFPDQRSNVKFSLTKVWNYIKANLDKPEGVLDSRFEDNLLAILMKEGWRVVDETLAGVPCVSPHGRGVPGCFWAKQPDDDHPFWGRTELPVVPGV